MKRSGMKADAAEPAPRRGFWNGGTPTGGGALVCLYPIFRVDLGLRKTADDRQILQHEDYLPSFGEPFGVASLFLLAMTESPKGCCGVRLMALAAEGSGIGVFRVGGETGDRHEKQEVAAKC